MRSRVLTLALAVTGIALVGLAGLMTTSPGAATTQARPNILIIVSDDQPVGTTEGWMTNLTGWLKGNSTGGGTKFQNAFDTTPLCCPSRSSIFTGRYAHNHGVRTNDRGKVVFAPGAAANQTTLQYYLHEWAGADGSKYRTGLFGKYLNQWDVRNAPEYFDDYAVYNNGAHVVSNGSPDCPGTGPTDPNPYEADNTGGGLNCVGTPGNPARAVTGKYETTYLAENAESFISQAHQADPDHPWLLVMTPTVPHAPFSQFDTPYKPANMPTTPAFPTPDPPGYFETDPCCSDFLRDKPSYVRNLVSGVRPNTTPTTRGPCGALTTDENSPTDTSGNPNPNYHKYRNCTLTHIDAQYRMLKSMDDLVGRLRDALRSTNEEQDTLVFYISDNGYLWGQHWLEGKPYPYTESVHVPFFMRGPDVTPGAVDNTHMVANIDIAPTAMQAAGLQAPGPANGKPYMDGHNLLAPFTRNYILLERPGRQAPDPTTQSGASNPPLWASIRTLSSAGAFAGAASPYQYVETYASSAAPLDPSDAPLGPKHIYIPPEGLSPNWSEFYNLATDAPETANTYGDYAHYGDPGDSPSTADSPTGAPGLHTTLVNLLRCSGIDRTLPYPCP